MSISDDFLRGVRNAITDLREKVVEEPYFGRVVTNNVPGAPEPGPAVESVTFDLRDQPAVPLPAAPGDTSPAVRDRDAGFEPER